MERVNLLGTVMRSRGGRNLTIVWLLSYYFMIRNKLVIGNFVFEVWSGGR